MVTQGGVHRAHMLQWHYLKEALLGTPLARTWNWVLVARSWSVKRGYGSILPQLMHDWQLSPVTGDFIGSSALFGMMVGALTLGSSSDRFGRRRP